MQKNHLIAAAGGALLFLLGLMIGIAAGGPSQEDIEAAVADRLDAASAANAERIGKLEASVAALSGDLGGRLDSLGGRLDGLGTSIEASIDAGTKAVGDKLGGDVAGVGQTLSSAIEASKTESLAALESGLAGLRGQISAEPAAAPAAEAGNATDAAAPAAASPAAPVDGISPGETAVLSEGALRVFASRIDEAAGTAAVRANGADFVLAVGQSQVVPGAEGDCKLTLDAVGGGRASVSGACGAELPEPEGVAPGTTVALADGLRVFVSAVDADGARIAINGVTTEAVPLGQSVEVKVGEQTCKVSVEGVDRGRVALGYVCG